MPLAVTAVRWTSGTTAPTSGRRALATDVASWREEQLRRNTWKTVAVKDALLAMEPCAFHPQHVLQAAAWLQQDAKSHATAPSCCVSCAAVRVWNLRGIGHGIVFAHTEWMLNQGRHRRWMAPCGMGRRPRVNRPRARTMIKKVTNGARKVSMDDHADTLADDPRREVNITYPTRGVDDDATCSHQGLGFHVILWVTVTIEDMNDIRLLGTNSGPKGVTVHYAAGEFIWKDSASPAGMTESLMTDWRPAPLWTSLQLTTPSWGRAATEWRCRVRIVFMRHGDEGLRMILEPQRSAHAVTLGIVPAQVGDGRGIGPTTARPPALTLNTANEPVSLPHGEDDRGTVCTISDFIMATTVGGLTMLLIMWMVVFAPADSPRCVNGHGTSAVRVKLMKDTQGTAAEDGQLKEEYITVNTGMLLNAEGCATVDCERTQEAAVALMQIGTMTALTTWRGMMRYFIPRKPMGMAVKPPPGTRSPVDRPC